MHGIVDEKTDVFAFGVLLLELITGRRAVDSNSRESLVIWVSPEKLALLKFLIREDQITKVYVGYGNNFRKTETDQVVL